MESKLRQFDEVADETKSESRTPFERDRDRVLYSSAFRRLAGVTQVAAAHERQLLHNRLTHSLKVAQIGRRMAQRVIHPVYGNPALKAFIDPDVVETAGLAHDLGHPPFGHSSEKVLNEQLKDCDGFEGNAQSFRIVTKLSVIRHTHLGLNLTGRTLAAILKYPNARSEVADVAERRREADANYWWNRAYGKKWGYYRSETAAFEYARGKYINRQDVIRYERSPEAIIMDWADDISFATHDIEDYFRAGLIPLHDLESFESDLAQYGRKLLGTEPGFDPDTFREAYRELTSRSPIDSAFQYSREDRQATHDFTSSTITFLSSGLVEINEPPWVAVSETAQYVAEYLKTLTRYFVIDSPPTAIARQGQVRILQELFEQLLDWARDDPASPRIPRMLRSMLSLELRDPETFARYGDMDRLAKVSTADYICSLTEAQTVDLARRFSGIESASMFGAWF
ncbi:MAG: dNTP triphosphohydrolase [Chloroflexota bacterium]|nr:dNTP triphosphohydrolase [Chloroflexota bacterium]